MKSIGGYFSLEVNDGRELHANAIHLNAGRYALEYILKARGYHKIYIPYFICDSVLQPIHRLGVEYEFYQINEQLEPAVELNPKDDEVVLYVNYFEGANNAIGTLVLKFQTAEELEYAITHQREWLSVVVNR